MRQKKQNMIWNLKTLTLPKAKLQRQNFCQKVLQFICFLNPSKELFWYTLKPQMQVSFKVATSPSCRVILALFSLPPPIAEIWQILISCGVVVQQF